MAKCAKCGATILFGGERDGDRRYCRAECLQNRLIADASKHLPEDVLERQVEAVHQGPCPNCGGPGPVDVHTSHRVLSFLVATSWSSRPQLCCRRCGVKAKLADAAYCAALGWWGVPWGLLATPIQIGRNFIGMATRPDPNAPSADLRRHVKLMIGAAYADRFRELEEPAE